MKIFIINGPNINMLGIREPNIYGNIFYSSFKKQIKKFAHNLKIKIKIYQSNCEGKIIKYIQKAYFKKIDGIIINPASYTTSSIGILDAIKSVNIPTIEVHISNINKREEFRKKSLLDKVIIKKIIGKGINGYFDALKDIKEYINGKN